MSTISGPGRGQRLSTETKQAFKTTEFWVMVVLLIGLFIAGAVTGGDDGGATAAAGEATNGGDDLNAGKVWLYAVILAGTYLIGRGLAKSGSRDPYWNDPGNTTGEIGIGDRVKAAAEVLRDGPEATTVTAGTNKPDGTQGTQFQ